MGHESRLRKVLGLVRPDGRAARTTKVAVGYPFGGSMTYQFVLALRAMERYELAKPVPLFHYDLPQSGLYIDHNRNAIVEKFMKTDADWLLQIDSDISFSPQLIELMLACAGADKRILAASVPLGPPLPSSAWMMTEQPGIWRAVPAQHWCPVCANENYSLAQRPEGWRCVVCGGLFDVADERIAAQVVVTEEGIPVDGLATAVILIHREVFEAIADRVGQCWFLKSMQPRLTEAPSRTAWMEDGPMRDRAYISVGEDLAFCLRASDAGHQSWCAKVPGLKHHKTLPMSHDYEQAPAPAPATAEVAV